MSRLKDKYRKEVISALMERYGYKNVMEVPRLIKVVLNIGLGEAMHPVITRAKRSIANFKLRAGMPIGMKVTLRGERMYNFLDRLMNAVLPRVREFYGVPPNAFDGRGNYTLGLKEQIVFPEIDYDKIEKLRGMEIAVATTAKTDEEGRHLLELLGMPFAKDGTE